MDHTRTGKKGLHAGTEAVLLAIAFSGNRQQTGRFVQNNEIVVLVNDVNRRQTRPVGLRFCVAENYEPAGCCDAARAA